ncbi:MAG: glucosamine-6-phosphate deaminase [Lachnospiraceae bacterium]|nr:glucosamine-6-phosphate deaminase [Lachnospiraceae bacterium]
MKIYVDATADAMGKRAADIVAEKILAAIADHGECRMLLSTGASQFEMFEHLTKKDLPWDKVTGFHLDEYEGMPESHPASFVKYLKERFVNLVHPKAFYFIDGMAGMEGLSSLTDALRALPIDIGLIGIGENGHIAFNDPPADFDSTEAFKIVEMDEKCRRQQMGEGWFATLDDVPKKAISMTVYQIMQCKSVLSVCGGTRKAEAVKKTLEAPAVTNMVPATKLKEHADWILFLDEDSASLVDKAYL